MVNAPSDSNLALVSFTVNATDDSGSVTVLNNYNDQGGNFSDYVPIWLTGISFTARDAAGNEASCYVIVIVRDVTPPLLTCPSNITVDAGPGSNTAFVDFTVSATDNSGVVTVVNDYHEASGATVSGVFEIGSWPIQFTARDPLNNTVSCTALVIVRAGSRPTLACPPEVMAVAQHGSSTVTVSFPVYSSEDSGAVTVHKTHNSQAMTGSGRFSGDFSAGVTEVTFPASNPSNYTAQCTVRVVVRGR